MAPASVVGLDDGVLSVAATVRPFTLAVKLAGSGTPASTYGSSAADRIGAGNPLAKIAIAN
ncbi:MAG: hypothetical protein ABIT20_14280 [Gemmatimonadaceae bacterium]